ncbi:MAG: serine/threonine protein kinase [Verrucomicrobiales bacterium]|nr:serine/threonine protein kinase [Verrucomicrobiales bacterium]
MSTPERPVGTEKILGLDPRALLARRDTAERLRAWLPPEPNELAHLFPDFEILELLGRGGMGAVYRARQRSLDRDVAIKLLPTEAASDPVFADRFRNEARALGRLHHPNIVAIHEAGQTQAGHLFIVMEYVRGQDVAALLAQGSLPTARVIQIASSICMALEFAHNHGVIHRDIKPANVLIADDGGVKVADFGVARLSHDPNDTRLTFTGLALGTPDYMAPEQRSGGIVDARADLFSVGVMVYEMLTGHLPRGAWAPPSNGAADARHLDAVLQKAMQADPARRPQTAAELRSGLEGRAHSRMTSRWILLTAAALVVISVSAWILRTKPSNTDQATSALSSSSGQGRIGPATPADTAAGVHTPFTNLDLNRDVLFGHWTWLDGIPGGTLTAAYDTNNVFRCLRLPVQPGARAYEASFELLLEHKGSDLSVVIPVGASRVAVTLDLYDTSGLGLVAGKDWNQNLTSVIRRLPIQRFVPVIITVLPLGSDASITVLLDGSPLFSWKGPQAELTLSYYFAIRHLIRDAGQTLLLETPHGGIQVRNFAVRIE